MLSLIGCEYIAISQFGASIRSSPRRVLAFTYLGNAPPCNINESSPNMKIRPYIGEESGIYEVPELSRDIGSARLTDDAIVIRWEGPCSLEFAASWLGWASPGSGS